MRNDQIFRSGIAGLTTAYRLHQSGIDVELYEARGRVGGRIFTVNIDGRVAELGGQNLADGGKLTLNLNRLIQEFDLSLTTSRIYLNHFYLNQGSLESVNQILNDQQFDLEALKYELKKLAATHSNMREILEAIIEKDHPLYKIISVRMAAYEGGSVEELSHLYTDTLFHMLAGGICSVHQKDEEDAYIDLVTIKGGNALLPQKMGEALGSRLHLGNPLVKVLKNEDGGFLLTFQNGSEIKADKLVLAIPCSVYNQIYFENKVIPRERLENIQNIQYGKNGKILVPFDSIHSASGIIGDEIVSFFDSRQKMLTVYYTGSSSLFSDQTIKERYIEAHPILKQFDSIYLSAIPVYGKDEMFSSYEGPVGYSWPNDPYARGSYSYIASGQEDLLTNREESDGEIFKSLFVPIEQKLYFAGEHASILTEVPGTIEAACESGERVARAIIRSKKN